MLQPSIQRADAKPPALSDLKSRNFSGSCHSFKRLPVHPQQRRGFVEAEQVFKRADFRIRSLRSSRWRLLLKIQGCRRMCHWFLLCRTARPSLVSNDGIMSFFAASVKLATKDRYSGCRHLDRIGFDRIPLRLHPLFDRDRRFRSGWPFCRPWRELRMFDSLE